jgi:DNA-binding IclR family transcriptional regulator
MPIIQSVERALKILDLFDASHQELKITEISRRLSLHKSTVHSLLKTLQAHQYIEQNKNGAYRLGLKLLERSSQLVESLDISKLAKDYLASLSQQTGQTVHLVVRDRQEGVYIDKVEGNQAVIRYSRIGGRVPLHSSAAGKALVAFLPQEQISEVLQGYVYKVHTQHTLSSESAFRKELMQVRENGFAEDNQENEPGVYCMAVPIRNYSGGVVAAMSLSMLSTRVSKEDWKGYIDLLLQTGEALSSKLGA